VLGEAVIGFLYLVPIAWSATKWGRAGGLSAALAAALCFDFLFISPYYTFVVGSLESWLMLVIFFSVAVIVIDWIQGSLATARESTLLYELTSSLANARTPGAVTHTVARYTRQLFQAELVIVTFHPSNRSTPLVTSEPDPKGEMSRPDRILPILNAWGLVGEIQIWRGNYSDLPAEDNPLLRGIALQTGRAFERTQSYELERTGSESNTGMV
jgi:K+-sensing histidine kinase KdpD